MHNNIRAYYDKQADWDPAYFDWKISHYRANRAIMLSFDWLDWKDKKVLDIGCGQGYFTIPVAKRCEQIVGFDLSSANVENAIRHAARHNLTNAIFRQSDLFDFVPESPFDVAYAVTVLMHIPDIEKALLKISTFLKPGGHFLISDLNRYFHTRLFLRWRKAPFFYRTFTFDELRKALGNAGFRVVHASGRLYSLGGRRKPEWMVSLALERWAGHWPIKYMGEHIAVLAEKI